MTFRRAVLGVLNVRLFILSFGMIFLTIGSTQTSFSWLRDIEAECSWPHPIVISNPTGGYTAIWEYIGEAPTELPGMPPRQYFFRMVDAAGKRIVSKGEFEFWRLSTTPSYIAVLFNPRALLWINTDRLLILGWKYYHHGVVIDRVIVNSKGEIVAGPDSAAEVGVGERAVLVNDHKGGVTAFDRGAGLRAKSVYPEFRKTTMMSHQEWKDFDNKYPSDVFTFHASLPCMITSEDKLLMCSRLGWGKTPRNERGPWDFFGRPDKVFYILVDLTGNVVSVPVVFDLAEYAFRQIPGVHLGGNYLSSSGNRNIDELDAADNDMDLIRLPDGSIILSVTGEDETGKLCVYQVRFSADGAPVKPTQLEVTMPRKFPKDRLLPVSKVGWAEGVNTYIVRFGFDEHGDFYGEREIWREGDEP